MLSLGLFFTKFLTYELDIRVNLHLIYIYWSNLNFLSMRNYEYGGISNENEISLNAQDSGWILIRDNLSYPIKTKLDDCKLFDMNDIYTSDFNKLQQ